MLTLDVKKVDPGARDSMTLFGEIDALVDRVRTRAYELAAGRDFCEGHALDDWLAAEREYCCADASLRESESGYALEVALPGFEAKDVTVAAAPREVLVRAVHHADGGPLPEDMPDESVVRRRAESWRRIEFSRDIDVAGVSASLHDGLLVVVVPKLPAGQADMRISAAP
jgi:HSP20 family molecular chaperone IbpA